MSNEPKLRSMLEDISATPSNAEMLKRGALPESCEFNLDTAWAIGRDLTEKVKDTPFAADVKDLMEQLKEMREKIKRVKAG